METDPGWYVQLEQLLMRKKSWIGVENRKEQSAESNAELNPKQKGEGKGCQIGKPC